MLFVKYFILGSNVHSKVIQTEGYVEFLFGNNIDSIYVRRSKLYDSFKNILEQLKEEKSKFIFTICHILTFNIKNYFS